MNTRTIYVNVHRLTGVNGNFYFKAILSNKAISSKEQICISERGSTPQEAIGRLMVSYSHLPNSSAKPYGKTASRETLEAIGRDFIANWGKCRNLSFVDSDSYPRAGF
jgi:hypothetical protein